MADTLTAEVRDTLTPALEKLAEGAVDFTRNEDEMHAALAGITQRNFDTRGGLVGGWPARKARRLATPVDHPIMQQTGGLVGRSHAGMRRAPSSARRATW